MNNSDNKHQRQSTDDDDDDHDAHHTLMVNENVIKNDDNNTNNINNSINNRGMKNPLNQCNSINFIRKYRKRFKSKDIDDDDVDGGIVNDNNDDDDNQEQQQQQRKSSIINNRSMIINQPMIIVNSENSDEHKIMNNYSMTTSKPNRPPNIRWKQQQLPAWQPILKPIPVTISFMIIGILCILFGVFLYITNEKIQEIVIDYTDCYRISSSAPNSFNNDQYKCYEQWKYGWTSCQCIANFTVQKTINGPIYLYYSLNGFYQNHRRYISSLDTRQLLGEQRSLAQIRSNCYPYADTDNKIIAPCGAIANSMFSDSFELYRINNNGHKARRIDILEKDISWPTDYDNLYKNPSDHFAENVKPKNWTENFYGNIMLNERNPAGFGYKNEHLIVWMRPAAFPTFRKLWGRIDTHQLLPGHYQFLIDYNFQSVTKHLRIPKKLILSNMSWLGGRNPFLAILYTVVGITLLVTAIIFIIFYTLCHKRLENEPLVSVSFQQRTSQPNIISSAANAPTAAATSSKNNSQTDIKNHFQFYHSTSSTTAMANDNRPNISDNNNTINEPNI